MNGVAVAPTKSPDENLGDIRELWEGFRENYDALRNNTMCLEDEDKYRLLSSPGPSQYAAFAELFDLFKAGAQIVNEKPCILYNYDLVDAQGQSALPLLEFLQNLCSSAYDTRDKDVVMASGSFWEHLPETRKKVISCFEELHGKGAKVSFYAQAKEDEQGITGIIEPIKKGSHFGLKRRIRIHFVKVGEDFIMLELPHTESTLFRLNIFLDLNEIEPYLQDKTKKDLLNFFDNIIREAL